MIRLEVSAVVLVDDEEANYRAAVAAGVDPIEQIEWEVHLALTEPGYEGEDMRLSCTLARLTVTKEVL